MINVTKTFLPPFEDYTNILKRAWDKAWITNNGELVLELEQKLKEYLGVNNLLFCSNGTIVLQMAIKALGITKEVITTPFSYVATTNALLWEGCKPVFVDIRPDTFCIDESKIEAAITDNTEAILATHVYGFPCEVEKIDEIAKKYNLKVIYDGAHAFGSQLNGRSLLDYGDITTCSFHATKLFHTVEGGCIVCNDNQLAEKLYLLRSFGHIGDNYYSEGINGKNSEFHAAMGLANLPYLSENIEKRKVLAHCYFDHIKNPEITCLLINQQLISYNYSYFPVLFSQEEKLINKIKELNKIGVFPRRYFYPSLNELPFLESPESCPISEDVSKRILCLPLYPELKIEDVRNIADMLSNNS